MAKQSAKTEAELRSGVAECAGHVRDADVHWLKLMESASKNSKSKNSRRTWPRFVICLDNEVNEVSLERGKVYRQVKPRPHDMDGWVRVIDESGEDYLFPGRGFISISLPPVARRVLGGPAVRGKN